MSAVKTPSKTAPIATGTPATPTGSWRHPAMDAITKRKSETSFTTASFYKVTHNTGALLASFLADGFVKNSKTITSVAHNFLPAAVFPAIGWLIFGLRLIFVINILESLSRLVRTQDDYTDMPLTPAQRKLLGLSPDTPLSSSVKPSDFVTPPRYQKATPSSQQNSPMRMPNSGSPNVSRKLSFKSPEPENQEAGSPLRSLGPAKMAWGSASGSPKATGSSLTPSNRWAYDKSIMQRKSDGTDVRISPSKNLFGPMR